MVDQVRLTKGQEQIFYKKLEVCTDELIAASVASDAAIVTAQDDATQALADAATADAKAVVAQGLLAAGYKLLRGTYRFASQGGTISSIPLKNDAGTSLTLPDNAIILHTFIDVHTTPNSAADGSSVSIGIVADEDIKAEVVEASFTGLMDGIQNNAMANAIKLSEAKVPYVKIVGEDLTSGSFDVYFGYILGN